MCAVRKCIDNSRILKPVITSVLKLVKTIARSTNYKPLLLKHNGGRGLLSPSQTRWVYTYYVLKRLIESKEAVEKVIIEENLSEVALDPLKWKQIEQIRDLLQPFATAVNELEGDSYSTLNKVIPNVLHIINRITKISTNFKNVAIELKYELEERFDYILNIKHASFQPAHMLATFFDPKFGRALSKEQQNYCIQLIIQELTKNDLHCHEEKMPSNSTSLDPEQEKYSGFFETLENQRCLTPPTIGERSKLFKLKLEHYVEEIASSTASLPADAFSYWLDKKESSPEISNYALNLLVAPASSAGIERVFSLASIVQNRRYRLGAGNTEKELMIKVNRGFLMNK